MAAPIYLDYHATTPCDARVLAAMLPYFTETFGNPASTQHVFGRDAGTAVAAARAGAAALVAAAAEDLYFTSGATESNNLAIKGCARAIAAGGGPRRIVTVATEHRSVLDSCVVLRDEGFDVEVLPVDAGGFVDLADLERALATPTALVSVMTANNEIGTLQPVSDIATLAHAHGALFHTDATQAAGKVPFSLAEVDADLASFTGHKMYGPKGVGALVVRRRSPRLPLTPQAHGGGQERGMRSGTLNVPGIVGFGAACEIAAAELDGEARRLAALRDRLLRLLEADPGGVHVNGPAGETLVRRLPGNLSVSFDGADAESLLGMLDGVAVSTGSACASANRRPSHVLTAIGCDDERANASLRFGLGRATTEEEIDRAAAAVAAAVRRVRATNPGWSARPATQPAAATY